MKLLWNKKEGLMKFIIPLLLTFVTGYTRTQIISLIIAEEVRSGQPMNLFVLRGMVRSGGAGCFVCAVPSAVFLPCIYAAEVHAGVEAENWKALISRWTKLERSMLVKWPVLRATLDDIYRKSGFQLFQSKFRVVLLIGMVKSSGLQQWCRINAVFNYAEENIRLQVMV